ncbi:MAG: hypothetical protein IJO75_06530 [Clostridia bacterium]|nr:hypothetical protein [Clostridia bacterium]
MKEVMRDVWHGRVMQQKEHENTNPNLEELTRLMEKNRGILCSLMNEQEKERFEKYTDCVEEYISLIAEKAFREGAGFAARFLVEALG